MADDDDARLEAARIEARVRQYRVYVEWAERLIDRRAGANRFYLALNSAILGVAGFVCSDQLACSFAPPELMAAVLAGLGVIVSWNWRSIIKSQRAIVGAKFEVTHMLEASLPSQPYTDEWNLADGKRRGISPGRFELRLPTLFAVFYLGLLIWISWRIIASADLDLTGLLDASPAS